MINKKEGNKFEHKVCEYLQKKGFWCHLFAYDNNGQPCDIIACKNNLILLIDAKNCETNRFNYGRIEPNQHTCFNYAHTTCGIINVGFVLGYKDKMYWLPYERVMHDTKKSCIVPDLVEFDL